MSTESPSQFSVTGDHRRCGPGQVHRGSHPLKTGRVRCNISGTGRGIRPCGALRNVTAWALVLGLAMTHWSSVALAQDDDLAEGAEQTVDDMTSQGKLYLRRKRPKQALKFLDRAYRTKEGGQSFDVVFLRAQAAQQLLLLEIAFEMSKRAKQLAGKNKKRLARVSEFQEELDGLYGELRIRPAKGETNEKGRIFLEAKTGIINKKKRDVFMTIRKRFRETEIQIPATIYIPHGQFLANNVPVKIARDKPAEVEVYLQVQRVEEGPNWWLLGGGAAAALTAGIGAMLLLGGDDPEPVERIIINPTAP